MGRRRRRGVHALLLPEQEDFGGERPGATGVTEEHVPGPATGRFPVGSLPFTPHLPGVAPLGRVGPWIALRAEDLRG